MKFLADMGISLSIVRFLLKRGHDATHLREEGLFRLEDAKIVKARAEGRIVLTFDLDFGGIMAGSPRDPALDDSLSLVQPNSF